MEGEGRVSLTAFGEHDLADIVSFKYIFFCFCFVPACMCVCAYMHLVFVRACTHMSTYGTDVIICFSFALTRHWPEVTWQEKCFHVASRGLNLALSALPTEPSPGSLVALDLANTLGCPGTRNLLPHAPIAGVAAV